MSAKERRERERADFKTAVLAAARHIAQHDGWQAVSLRKVADRVEYSAAALYEYFPSKDAILHELMVSGFGLLADELTNAGSTNDGHTLQAVAGAYWDFAFANPDLYQVMYGLGGIAFGTDQTPPEAVAAFAALRNAVQVVMPDGGAKCADLDGEVDAFWAMLHGMVSLTMGGRIKGGEERAAEVFGQAVQIYSAAWQANEKRCEREEK